MDIYYLSFIIITGIKVLQILMDFAFMYQVANLIGADAKSIVFTSGATESNNIAIKGVARFYKGEWP